MAISAEWLKDTCDVVMNNDLSSRVLSRLEKSHERIVARQANKVVESYDLDALMKEVALQAYDESYSKMPEWEKELYFLFQMGKRDSYNAYQNPECLTYSQQKHIARLIMQDKDAAVGLYHYISDNAESILIDVMRARDVKEEMECRRVLVDDLIESAMSYYDIMIQDKLLQWAKDRREKDNVITE